LLRRLLPGFKQGIDQIQAKKPAEVAVDGHALNPTGRQ
jgi:hypothetical protein